MIGIETQTQGEADGMTRQMTALDHNPDLCTNCALALVVKKGSGLVSKAEAGQELECLRCGQEYAVGYKRSGDGPFEFSYALITKGGEHVATFDA